MELQRYGTNKTFNENIMRDLIDYYTAIVNDLCKTMGQEDFDLCFLVPDSPFVDLTTLVRQEGTELGVGGIDLDNREYITIKDERSERLDRFRNSLNLN